MIITKDNLQTERDITREQSDRVEAHSQINVQLLLSGVGYIWIDKSDMDRKLWFQIQDDLHKAGYSIFEGTAPWMRIVMFDKTKTVRQLTTMLDEPNTNEDHRDIIRHIIKGIEMNLECAD